MTLSIGREKATLQQVIDTIKKQNPNFDPQIAELFYEIAPIYGLRADLVMAQAVLETGWFKFGNGTAVTPDQYNYGGIGVTQKGIKGAEFRTMAQGVEAMIQHVYAYMLPLPIPEGRTLYDPRFSLVSKRGYFFTEKMAGLWAVDPNYGSKIMNIQSQFEATPRTDAAATQGVIPNEEAARNILKTTLKEELISLINSF